MRLRRAHEPPPLTEHESTAWRPLPLDLGAGDKHRATVLEFASGLPYIDLCAPGEGDEDLMPLLDQIERSRRAAVSRIQDQTDHAARAAAAVNVIADLVRQGARVAVDGAALCIGRAPAPTEKRARRHAWRRQFLAARADQLREASVQRFVRSMIAMRPLGASTLPVQRLFRDGPALAAVLKGARDQAALEKAVAPYVQIVEADKNCEYTGLNLQDIWRYFRHTWSTPFNKPPGRNLSLLIRDAAAPGHPVMGIAAINNAPIRHRRRDLDFIRWEPEQVLEEVGASDPARLCRWLTETADARLAELYTADLVRDGVIARVDLDSPSQAALQRLDQEARRCREHHRAGAGTSEPADEEPSGELAAVDWEARAHTPLMRSKRAQDLSRLLAARAVIRGAMDSSGAWREAVASLLQSQEGRSAAETVVRAARDAAVGVGLGEISVCGAVPPYGPLVVGKLVAMLCLSVEVCGAYAERYRGTANVIASAKAGRHISTGGDLLYLGTSSLYPTRPCQYDRVSIPVGNGRSIKYQYLGKSSGYGSFQWSAATVRALQRVHRSVNYVFGEGTSPKMRALRDSLAKLGLGELDLLRHGHERPTYGVSLAEDLRGHLLGLSSDADNGRNDDFTARSAEAITSHWRERWLERRLGPSRYQAVVSEVRRHALADLGRHGAFVDLSERDLEQGRLF